jgi:hypothetical protein
MVGSQHEGAQTASFSLLAVASYTIHMSSSPLGTAKYFMYDLMVAPLAIVKYRRLITFLIFSITFTRITGLSMVGWPRWVVGPAFSKNGRTPSLASFRYCLGNLK